METENTIKRKVFISYASDMYDIALAAYEDLEKYGVEIWLDRRSIAKGKDGWIEAIDSGILSCDIMVVLLNNKSADSQYVTYEWSFALGAGKTVIGVRFEECDIHPRLANTQLFMNGFMNGQRPWHLLAESVLSVDIGEGFRQKAREFISVSSDVFDKHHKLGVPYSEQSLSNEDYKKIVDSGYAMLQAYSKSSTPIKAHYMSDIISFKSTYYNFFNKNWQISAGQSIMEVREMFVIASTTLR